MQTSVHGTRVHAQLSPTLTGPRKEHGNQE